MLGNKQIGVTPLYYLQLLPSELQSCQLIFFLLIPKEKIRMIFLKQQKQVRAR